MRGLVIYGLDAEPSGWIAARASRSWLRRVRAAAGEADPVPAVDAATRLLADMTAAAGGGGRTFVAAAMPSGDCVVRRIDVPLASERRARRVLPSLLDVRMPFRLEDSAFAFMDFRPRADGLSALAIAAPLDAVRRRLDYLASFGVDPAILDPEAVALWWVAESEFGATAPGEARIVAHATPDRWVLAIGDAAGMSNAATLREIPNRDPSQPAHTGALIARLRQAARTLTSGSAPRPIEWIWTGWPAPLLAAWKAAVEPALGAEGDYRFTTSAEPAMALARALARRAMVGAGWASNLRAGELVHRGVEAQRRRAIGRAAAALLTASAVWGGVETYRIVQLDRAVAAMEVEVAREARRIGGLSRVQAGLEVRMARDGVERRLAAQAPLDRLFQPSQTAKLAGLLRAAGQWDVHLQVVDLSDRSVRIEGTAPDGDAARRLAGVLKVLGVPSKLTEADVDAASGRVAFTLESDRS